MRKRSLHIGINDYPGTDSDLQGCVNDAHAWKEVLHKRGFDWQDILLDAGAFKKAITDAMADILVATEPGDLAVITYSGHGTWVPDEDGDEPDGRDEALCPWDMDTNGEVITDDELFVLFTDCIKEGAKVVFISDSCHSGSVARHAPRDAGPFANETWSFQKAKFLPPSFVLTPEGIKAAYKVEKSPARGKSRDAVLLMSGCQDTEYSYDAYFNQKPSGAFTHVALYCLDQFGSKAVTYRQWYDAIRKYLPHQQYPQTPQLSGPGQDDIVFGA